MFRAPAGVAVAIVTMLAIVWLLTNATALDVRDTAVAAAVGLAIFLAHRGLRRRDPSSPALRDAAPQPRRPGD
jgi:hypothetical protein